MGKFNISIVRQSKKVNPKTNKKDRTRVFVSDNNDSNIKFNPVIKKGYRGDDDMMRSNNNKETHTRFNITIHRGEDEFKAENIVEENVFEKKSIFNVKIHRPEEVEEIKEEDPEVAAEEHDMKYCEEFDASDIVINNISIEELKEKAPEVFIKEHDIKYHEELKENFLDVLLEEFEEESAEDIVPEEPEEEVIGDELEIEIHLPDDVEIESAEKYEEESEDDTLPDDADEIEEDFNDDDSDQYDEDDENPYDREETEIMEMIEGKVNKFKKGPKRQPKFNNF